MFVCVFIIPLDKFSTIWRRHHYRWRAANLYLCSTLVAFEHWGFCSASHLLWHCASVYLGHLRGPITLTSWRALSSGAVTTCFYDSGLSWLGFEQPTFHLQGPRSNRLRWCKNEKYLIFWFELACLTDIAIPTCNCNTDLQL